MVDRTIARMYDSHETAVAVVQELEQAGIPADSISIVARNRDDRYAPGPNETGSDVSTAGERTGTGAGTGASAGAVIGGGAGLLAGLGMLAIPGVGPVVAAGWLVATLAGAGVGAAAGAAAGGLVGSLTEAGVPEDDAHVYAESVRRGSSLVTVLANEADASRIEAIMNRTAFVDPAQRRAEYEAGGWSRFDKNAPPYASAPDGTPANPPGTATSRAFDRAAGTNVSGAYPSQSDGTPANPPGTAAERAIDRLTGSNTSGANPERRSTT